MCGRFVIYANKDEIVEIFDVEDSQLPVFEAQDNIPPGTHIPFISQAKNKQRQLNSAYWGLIPSWAKDKSFAKNTFNARSETVTEKPSFRDAYKHRRCLIPASAYYEWEKVRVNGKVAGKQPYRVERNDKSLFAFAGLYEHWTDKSSGEVLQSCSIITRDAYATIDHIHPRMPIILPADQYQAWLDAKLDGFPMIAEDELSFSAIETKVGASDINYEFNF